ncbi:hypothetical protein [Neptunicoccus cionae]|uniref:hypothetical protein n=1 Tax=Neptunicoccus cionae TaxID=2035344 RepID=UPI001667D61D|nr:hypothetical protein [Amylibacter cionae]
MIVTAQDLEIATWIGHSDRGILRQDMATALSSLGLTNLGFAFESASAGAIFEMLGIPIF